MIKITNRDLDKTTFTKALTKLNDCEGLSGKQAYWIMRLTKECDKQVIKLREDFQQLVEKYAVKGEDGKPKFTEDGKAVPETGFPFNVEDKEQWSKALEELYKDGFETKFSKFSLDDLTELGFKPSELQAIEMLIETPEYEDE